MVGRHREQAVMLVSDNFVKLYKIIQLFSESIPLSAVKLETEVSKPG